MNGVYLPQEWNGDFASGSGSYSGVTDLQHNEWFRQRDLDLEWKSACLYGNVESDEAAQVVTVNIKAIDGQPVKAPSGFTISFKQQTSPPSLLRLEPVPNPSASDKEVAESWREPLPSRRLLPLNTTGNTRKTTSQSLENEYRELKLLQAELQVLQKAIAEKKEYINSELRKEVKSFTDELNHCSGITCIVKTVAQKAHGAWKIVVYRFQSEHQQDESKEMGRPEDVFAQAHGHVAQISGGRVKAEATVPMAYTPLPYEASAVSRGTQIQWCSDMH